MSQPTMARMARRCGGTCQEHHAPAPGGRQPDDDPQPGQVAVLQGGQVQVNLVEILDDLAQPSGQRGEGGLVDLAGQRVARYLARDPGYPQHPVVVERGLVAELRGLRAVRRDHPAAAGRQARLGGGVQRDSVQRDGVQLSAGQAVSGQLSPEHTMPPASGDRTDLADCCQRGPRTAGPGGAMTNVEATYYRGVLGGFVTTFMSMPESGRQAKPG